MECFELLLLSSATSDVESDDEEDDELLASAARACEGNNAETREARVRDCCFGFLLFFSCGTGGDACARVELAAAAVLATARGGARLPARAIGAGSGTGKPGGADASEVAVCACMSKCCGGA